MSSPWLLLDVSYLAYRAYFSMGRLRHGDVATGVVYGVLREVLQLQELFATKRVAFCFDLGKPLRCDICPGYKLRRHSNKTEEELAAIEEIRGQVHAMRKDYLPTIGYQNILYAKGYEADDIIANIVLDRPKKSFVIVSSDKDLYQLFGPRVSIWNPHAKRLLTEKWFRKEFGIAPLTWVDVKAMAGCDTDEVEGIDGIGEKTAARFLRGDLKPESKAFEKIVKGNAIWEANKRVVSIPYPGLAGFSLGKDDVTYEGWRKIIKRLGMDSLTLSIPGIQQRTKKPSLGVFKKGKKNARTR